VEVVPWSWIIARFQRFYPGLFQHETHPTRDRLIPAAWFDVYYQSIDAVETVEQLRQANGVAHGEAMLRGDKHAVGRMTRELAQRAFPTVQLPVTRHG
jgi:hypothetical protein